MQKDTLTILQRNKAGVFYILLTLRVKTRQINMCTSLKPNTNWGGKVSQHYSELMGCDLRAIPDRVTDFDMKSWVMFYNLQYSLENSFFEMMLNGMNNTLTYAQMLTLE